jgi:hypothetical protein
LPLHEARGECEVLKATGIPGGGETPNANAHVNELTKASRRSAAESILPS